jgi:putative Mn2+ efflux pump MntP
MILKDNMKMLITGIGLFIIPIIVLSTTAIEGRWASFDEDWRGILGSLLLFGFGIWAIWDSFTASSPSTEASSPSPQPTL